MKTNSNFINCIVMMIVMALSSMGTMAQQTYISDVYIRYGGEHKWNDKDPLPDGYIMIDQDLNEHQGGDYVYLCYKTTTDIREAITDLIVLTGDGKDGDYNYSGKKNITYWLGGREYHAAGYSEHSDGGQLNQGRSGDDDIDLPMWLYYTKQGSADIRVCKPSAITSLSLEWTTNDTKDSFVDSYGYLTYVEAEISMNEGYFSDDEWLFIDVTRSSDERHSHWLIYSPNEPTCTTAGNIESRRCIDCGRYFDDSYTTEYSPEETVIPALGHDWDKIYDETTGAWQLDCKRCKHNEVRKQMCITANENDVFLNLWSEINPGDDDDWYGGTYELPEVQYALNGGPWETFTDNDRVRMNQGDMVWLRGNNIYFSRDESNYTWFKISGSASATGNVTSLIDNTGEGTDYPFDHCFYRLFEGSELETSPRLNATRLSENCYEEMFYGCTNLREVTLCATDKSSVESAIGGWLDGTAANGIVHITDELALADANLQLPTGWKADKVGIHANEDPDNAGDYYATFYDSQSEYTVKEGTKAYTGIVDGDVLNMTAEADNIIPAGEGVLLKGNTADVILTLSDTEKEQTPGNALTGSDDDTTASANSYIFTYAQNGLGFYQYAVGKPLTAHKAYLVYEKPNDAKGFRMVFEGMNDGIDGIESLTTAQYEGENAYYNLSGQRLGRMQKGINIVGGKKIIVK